MKKTVLLLGDRGKIGYPINHVLKGYHYNVVGKNTSNYNALNNDETESIIKQINPDVVINAIGLTSTDRCEQNPVNAFRLNALFPRLLAEQSNKYGFLLIHFSTDAVFDGKKGSPYDEFDTPNPMSVYSMTKLDGDISISNIAHRFYILRLSLVFGPSPGHGSFIEHMMQQANNGVKSLHIADDLVRSPTYNMDIAKEVIQFIKDYRDYGVYHVANRGIVSLYNLIKQVMNCFDVDVNVEHASYRDFPYSGYKHIFTPIVSKKLDDFRNWMDALQDYRRMV